jgi:predicted nucleotidyltransferase
MLIRAKDKDEIIRLAEQVFSVPIKIWAYGSRVNGQAHDASDLDLVLITKNEKPVPIDQFIAFKETIIESNIPILVQVVDWYRIPENFQKNIEKNYIELYTNDNQSKT